MKSTIAMVDGSLGGPNARYWVVSGVYVDAAFTQFRDDDTEERLGPFASYKVALEEWGKLFWRTINSCRVY